MMNKIQQFDNKLHKKLLVINIKKWGQIYLLDTKISRTKKSEMVSHSSMNKSLSKNILQRMVQG